jgi:AcrR family transcriptional regulator
MTQHMTPTERTQQLTRTALKLAEKHGYLNVTRDQIAAAVGVSPALVSHHMGTMINLRRTLVRHAVEFGVLSVIGQAVAAGDPHAKKVPEHVKKSALASLAR